LVLSVDSQVGVPSIDVRLNDGINSF